jgi:hypothetical protein
MNNDNEYSLDYNEYRENPIDKFIFDETDYIMDLYYDLRDRLPYFLDKLKFSDLLHFIINIKFNLKYNCKRYNPDKLYYFESEYSTELTTFLYVINNYMKKYKNFIISYDIFLIFAYQFTSVY